MYSYEKRRTLRIPVVLPVSFHPLDAPSEDRAFASTVDLSATGLCILTKEELARGQRLKLDLDVPHQKLVSVHVEVMRVEDNKTLALLGGVSEFKVGLKIVEPFLGDESRYVQFVAETMRAAQRPESQGGAPGTASS